MRHFLTKVFISEPFRESYFEAINRFQNRFAYFESKPLARSGGNFQPILKPIMTILKNWYLPDYESVYESVYE